MSGLWSELGTNEQCMKYNYPKAQITCSVQTYCNEGMYSLTSVCLVTFAM